MLIMDCHAPLMDKKKKRGIDQPWLTGGITSAIRDRNAQLKKARIRTVNRIGYNTNQSEIWSLA